MPENRATGANHLHQGKCRTTEIELASLASGGPDHQIKIENLIVGGYEHALNITGGHKARINDAKIRCISNGARLSSSSAEISNVQIDGCGQAALTLHAMGNAEASGLIITNSSLGMVMTLAPGEQALSITDSTMAGNALALYSMAQDTQVERTCWLMNGHESSWLDRHGYEPGAIAFVQGSAEIHESSFDGNRFLAVNALLASVDARGNWWGHPMGPTIGTYGVEYPKQVLGDSVAPTVQYHPFQDSSGPLGCI